MNSYTDCMNTVDASKLLDGRVVVVTGGGRGIGRQHALSCAAHGARVVVNDLGVAPTGVGGDGRVASAVVDEIRAAGGEAVANTDSVTDWQGARRIVDAAVESYSGLHVVINNAGTNVGKPMISMTEDEFDDVLAVKLKGSFAVSRWAARYWRDQYDAGVRADRVIINTASGSGLLNPLPLASAYASANAGVGALTIVQTLELARYGIRVNAIAPSMARSRLTSEVPGMAEQSKDSYDPFDPVHQAVVATQLARSDCRLTGQVLTVRGSTVTPNRNWSPGAPLTKEGAAWEPDELGAALAGLSVEDQFDKLLDALGPVYGLSDREQLQQLVNAMLDRAEVD